MRKLRVLLILPLVGAAVALALLPITSSDFTNYVIPWLRALQQRGAAGVSGEFSNFQIGSLASYLAYFGLSMDAPGFAVVPITAGLLLLLMAFGEAIGQYPRRAVQENGAAGED